MKKIVLFTLLFVIGTLINVDAQQKESSFLEGLSQQEYENLKSRIERANNLIRNQGIKFYGDVGEMLTSYAYGELYDWNLYFENIWLSYFWEATFYRTNLEAFLDKQLNNGFVPRTYGILWPKPTHPFKPFLAQTALWGSKETGNFKWLEGRYFYRQKKYLEYLQWHCDYDKNGLAIWNSGDHRGMDNQDSRAGRLDEMIAEGVNLNCYLVMEFRAMKEIAKQLGIAKDVEQFAQKEKELTERINDLLWDEENGFYFDRNERTGEHIKVMSVAGFIPLWAGIASKGQAKRIIESHLLDISKFWLNYPVSSYSKQEPDYYQGIRGVECNWHGSAWIPSNYMIFHGLLKYGYTKEAKHLAQKSYELVMGEENLREYYNAETDVGDWVKSFLGMELAGLPDAVGVRAGLQSN